MQYDKPDSSKWPDNLLESLNSFTLYNVHLNMCLPCSLHENGIVLGQIMWCLSVKSTGLTTQENEILSSFFKGTA